MSKSSRILAFLWLVTALLIGGHAADGTWLTLASMTDPRQEVGVAELSGKIYAVGGLPRTNLVQEYNPAANTWRFAATLPIAVDHTAAASVGGKLYVMGGFTSAGNTNLVYEYDPGKDQWTQKSPLPTARGALAAAVIGSKIYVVGGMSSTQRELEVYDPATDSWTQLAPMLTGRNHLAAGAIKGKLYVAGGRPGNLDVLEVYDPSTNIWTTKKPMPTGRSGHAGAVVQDRFYTFGGEGNPNSPIGIFKEAEVYDPLSDSWKSLEPMKTPRHGIGAAAVGNRIYVPAGATQQGGGTETGTNEAFAVQSEKLYFAHFASGQSISTVAILGNLQENQEAVATLELFDQSGNPLQADLNGSVRSTLTSIVRPLGSVTLRSQDSSTTPRVGSVVVSSDAALSGTILFTSTIPGFGGIAGVGASPFLTRFFVPVQRDPFTQIQSGIAISNTTDSAVTVNLVLRNESGAVLSRRELKLPARGQTASFLEQLFPDADIVTFSFRGTVTATSTGAVAALALLFTGNGFATLPVSSY